MKYCVYLCLVLFTLASCKSSRFTKQRYTHYHVSSAQERFRSITRSTVKDYSAAQASARPEVVVPASPKAGVAPSPYVPLAPQVVSGGWRSAPTLKHVPLHPTKQGMLRYAEPVKQHFRQLKEQQRGPISFLLELIVSIVVLIVVVFLVLILVAIL